MIIVDPVLETYAALDFTAWPIAELTSDRILPLSGQMTTAEVACAMAVIFAYADIPTEPISDLHHHLDRHLVSSTWPTDGSARPCPRAPTTSSPFSTRTFRSIVRSNSAETPQISAQPRTIGHRPVILETASLVCWPMAGHALVT